PGPGTGTFGKTAIDPLAEAVFRNGSAAFHFNGGSAVADLGEIPVAIEGAREGAIPQKDQKNRNWNLL
ncbi:MAG TPA: hypothetical protein VGI11_11290, partial [Variovorax sp.]